MKQQKPLRYRLISEVYDCTQDIMEPFWLTLKKEDAIELIKKQAFINTLQEDEHDMISLYEELKRFKDKVSVYNPHHTLKTKYKSNRTYDLFVVTREDDNGYVYNLSKPHSLYFTIQAYKAYVNYFGDKNVYIKEYKEDTEADYMLLVNSLQKALIELTEEDTLKVGDKDIYVWCGEAYRGVNLDSYARRYTLVLDK